jgi:hypothetical protein
MNVFEKMIIVPLLFLAFGLFFLGFTAIGFILGMCVALYLGSSTGRRRTQAPKEFPMPNGNWHVVYRERRVPVLYSSFARENVMRFMAGDSPEVELKQEPTQQLARRLSVYGHWMDPSGQSRCSKLGHIPHLYSERLFRESVQSQVYRLSAKVSQVFVPAQHKAFAGLALDIALLELQDARPRISPSLGQMQLAEHSMPLRALSLIDDASVQSGATGIG